MKAPGFADAAAAVARLTDDLMSDDAATPERASVALDRLRHRLRATDAVLWTVDGGLARPALRSGTSDRLPVRTQCVDGAPLPLERLRRNGTLFCGAGELSGIEALAPEGVHAFLAAAATPRATVSSVLVLGWGDPAPARDDDAFAPLRIAASLLGRVVTPHPDQDATSRGGIVQAFHDSAVVVDREGVIVAANAAWMSSGHRRGMTSGPAGPGANYIEQCRRAAASGSAAATVTLKLVDEVRRGAVDVFQAAYPLEHPCDDAWAILTITPLSRPVAGALLTHSDVTPHTVAHLSDQIVDRRIGRIVDALPGPVWIAAPDGRVTYASRQWADVSGDAAAGARRASRWLDAVHAGDRTRAEAVFAAAVSRREAFEVDVRLWSRGTYTPFTCVAAPLVNPSGVLESYVGVCVAGARQRLEPAGDHVAARLLAAQEAERSRIARDLHDDLGHQVVLLEAALDSALNQRGSSDGRSVLESTRRKLHDIAASIHTLAHTLHPAKLKLLGLVKTLHALCRDVAAETGQDVRFEARDIPPELGEDVVLCIFRVAQEALQNAVKHSGARTIDVHLAGAGPSLTLRVIDNGTGFDPDAATRSGLGLLTMRERVDLVGGTLTVTTAQTRGTAIEVTVNAGRRVAPV